MITSSLVNNGVIHLQNEQYTCAYDQIINKELLQPVKNIVYKLNRQQLRTFKTWLIHLQDVHNTKITSTEAFPTISPLSIDAYCQASAVYNMCVSPEDKQSVINNASYPAKDTVLRNNKLRTYKMKTHLPQQLQK